MSACPITQLASQLYWFESCCHILSCRSNSEESAHVFQNCFGSSDARPWDRLWPVSSFVGNLTEALGPYVIYSRNS